MKVIMSETGDSGFGDGVDERLLLVFPPSPFNAFAILLNERGDPGLIEILLSLVGTTS